MKHVCLILCLCACGGTPTKPTIHTQQDFQTVVGDLINQVIDIFHSDGINCEMLTSDLRGVSKSEKLAASKDWRTAHPEAGETLKEVIESHRGELEKAAGPGMRQCGVQLQTVLADLQQ